GVLAALGVGAAIAIAFWGARWRPRPLPSFQLVTFQRGGVGTARFTRDGSRVVYDADWRGEAEVFTARIGVGGAPPHVLGIKGHLLGISPTELAVLSSSRLRFGYPQGTLARLPIDGGPLREVLPEVRQADWNPKTGDLAIARMSGSGVEVQVEWPQGRPIATGY